MNKNADLGHFIKAYLGIIYQLLANEPTEGRTEIHLGRE
jgi:hypothetical protein